MKKRRFIIGFCSLLFCFALWGSFLPAYASGEEWQYTRSGDKNPAVSDAAALLALPEEEALSAGEAALLREWNFALPYTDALPAGRISCQETDEGLRVRASLYTYTAQNGEDVTFTPVAVYADGVRVAELSGAGSVTLTGLTPDVLHEIRVEYTARVYLSGAVCNRMLERLSAAETAIAEASEAYLTACEARAAGQAAYAAALAAYETAMEEYAHFEAESADYESYLAALAAFAHYESDLACYLTALPAYQAAMEEFTPRWDAYLQYEEKAAAVRGILTALGTLTAPRNRAVLENQLLCSAVGALENAGVPAIDLWQYQEASDGLLSLLEDADTDTEEALLAFAVCHRTELQNATAQLYCTLTALLGQNTVLQYLQANDATADYVRFAAALYAVSAYADDTVTFDGETEIGGETVASLLSPAAFVPDRNRFAEQTATLPAPVEKPVAPVSPVLPAVAEDPALRWEQPPTQPAPVDLPAEPVAADYFCPEEPAAPVFSEAEQALLADIRAGLIKPHSLREDRILTLPAFVTKSVLTEVHYTLSFYDEDETTLLWQTAVLPGGKGTYGGVKPCKADTETTVFTFAGWRNQEGEAADLGNIRGDSAFYAVYTAEPRTLRLTWRYRDGEKTTKVTAGTVPLPPLTPPDSYDATSVCLFVGWSPTPDSVTADGTVYTAQYETRLLAPVDGGVCGATVEKVTGYLRVTLPTGGKAVELSFLTSLATAQNRGVYFLCGEAKLTVSADAVPALAACRYLSFCPEDTGWFLAFSETEGLPFEKITVSLPVLSRTASVSLGDTRLSSRRESPFVSACFAGNGVYTRTDAYTLQAESSEGGKVTVSGKTFYPGDPVSVTVKAEKGYVLKSLTYTLTDGSGETQTHALPEDFSMPRSDVTVNAVFEALTYTVTFADARGAVLSADVCRYGEIPRVPDLPEKEGYRPIGWLPSPSAVTGDTLYTPLYEPLADGDGPTPAATEEDGIFAYLWIVILGGVFLAAGGVFAVAFLKKREGGHFRRE